MDGWDGQDDGSFWGEDHYSASDKRIGRLKKVKYSDKRNPAVSRVLGFTVKRLPRLRLHSLILC